MDYQRALITYVLRNNKAREVIDRRIKEDNFCDELKPVWQFIHEFYSKYQTSPNLSIVKDKFPKFSEVVEEASFDFLCDKLQEDSLYHRINKDMKLVYEYQKKKDPFTAVQVLEKLIRDTNSSIRMSNDVSWVGTTDDRRLLYEQSKSRGGITGIPCYWDTLTQITGGMNNCELWMYIGRSGSGKSWGLAIEAYNSHALGKKVLFFAKEMSYQQIFLRLDAIYAKVPFYKLRKGFLSAEEEYNYYESLDDLAIKANDLICISDDEGSGVAGIDSKIEKYNPDIVFVDGIYLLSDDLRGKTRADQIKNIAQNLKIVAKNRNIPIVCSTQLNREAEKDKGSRGEREVTAHIFGADVAQDADVIIEIYANPEMRSSKPQKIQATMVKFRQGSGEQWKKLINWDHDTMDFKELTDEEIDTFNPRVKQTDLREFGIGV